MSLVENLKEAADLAKKLGNIDLYKKIVELEGEIIEVTRQKLHLESKVEELQKQLALKAKMSFSQPFYYQDGDTVPFCPRCYEKETIAVHAVFKGEDSDGRKTWQCPDCKEFYFIDKLGGQNRQSPSYHIGP